ncbi:MAG: hypothetical protein IT342_04405 [Candidatus Melainabacteria bacterium]|nr:hypothetical protein [Candidatus Melainabacteria bacterium]
MPVINTGKFAKGGGSNTDTLERIIAGLCYLTVGLAGLIYSIVQGKYARTHFFRFHFIQSILLGLFYFLISMSSSIFINIVGGILQMIPGAGAQILMVVPAGLDILVKAGSLLLLYGLVMSLLGKEAPIPIVSKIVYQQLR